MDPKPSPPEMSDLTVIEQQLISRISPCINVILSISITMSANAGMLVLRKLCAFWTLYLLTI
jgi:hypothetical protein